MDQRVKTYRLRPWREIIREDDSYERSKRYKKRHIKWDSEFSQALNETIMKSKGWYRGRAIALGNEYGDVDAFPDLVNTGIISADDIRVVLNEKGASVPLLDYLDQTEDLGLKKAVGIFVNLEKVRTWIEANSERPFDRKDYLLRRKPVTSGTSSFDRYVIPKIREMYRPTLIPGVS